jgi:GTP-binding protein
VGVRDKDFVMMEVPGLLEGAHQGIGLGQEFLRHAERARVYIHLLDGTSDDPIADFHMLNNELKQFSGALAEKPQIIGVNKLDVTEVRDGMKDLARRLTKAAAEWDLETAEDGWKTPVMFLSAVTGEGVQELMDRAMTVLDAYPKEEVVDAEPLAPHRREYLPNKVWAEHGVYIVQSEALERLAALADTRDPRVMVQLWRELERRGMARDLIDAGIQAGDTIRIGKVEVEWF